jgi:hypothetical protein
MGTKDKWVFVLSRLMKDGTFSLKPPVSPEQEQCCLYFIGHGILTDEGSHTYKLTPKGQPLVAKFREQEAILRKGVPLDKRLDVLPAANIIFRFGANINWYRGKTKDNGTYQTDKNILLAGNPTFGLKDMKFSPATASMDARVDDVIYSSLEEMGLWQAAVPVKYQKRDIGNVGIIWYKSEELWFPMQEIYHDLLHTHWTRFDGALEYLIRPVKDDHDLMVVRYEAGPRGTKFKGSLVAVVSPMGVDKQMTKFITGAA